MICVYAWWNDLEKRFKIWHKFLEYENTYKFFSFSNSYYNCLLSYKCPGNMIHKQGIFIHSGKNKSCTKWKTILCIPKIWQISKYFTMTFHQAQSSHFWRVVAHNMISEFRTTFVQKRDKKIFFSKHYIITSSL